MGESRKAAKPFGIRFAGRLHVFEGEAAILFLVTAVTVTAVTKLRFFLFAREENAFINWKGD